MAVSKDEILDAISKMTLMEVVELISDMEKKFGVTAAAPVAVAAAPGAAAAAAAPVEEQTEFTVTLKEYPADRSEEHTSELQSRGHLVCRLLLEKKKHDRNSDGRRRPRRATAS